MTVAEIQEGSLGVITVPQAWNLLWGGYTASPFLSLSISFSHV